MQEDDLSLLAGVSEDERARNRSKGIFTVKQLSYTFRPRRTPKRAKNPARPRYPALQALAIRENTVFVHGSPKLPNSKTKVYLDIEGIPDSDSYYLIGTLIVSEDQEVFRSFWSDHTTEESQAFSVRRCHRPGGRFPGPAFRRLRNHRVETDEITTA
jgi:predicted RecB family nuclease